MQIICKVKIFFRHLLEIFIQNVRAGFAREQKVMMIHKNKTTRHDSGYFQERPGPDRGLVVRRRCLLMVNIQLAQSYLSLFPVAAL